MCQALGDKRRGAVEVKRGGALLGGQQTKRAWNLRFLSRLELSDTDTHTHCMFICQQPYMTHVDQDALCFWFKQVCEEACVWTEKSARVLYALDMNCKPLFIYASFFKSSKEKYCVSFSIQARDNSSFHESSGGMGWGSSENKRDRAGERGKISCFALASHCSHSLPYFPQHSFT